MNIQLKKNTNNRHQLQNRNLMKTSQVITWNKLFKNALTITILQSRSNHDHDNITIETTTKEIH